MSPEELRLGRRGALLLAVVVIAMIGLLLYSGARQTAFTLYRGSAQDPSTRIRVARFDVKDSEAYNQTNCRLLQERMQSQSGGPSSCGARRAARDDEADE